MEGEANEDITDVDEDPVVSDVYHRTLIECLPRVWPKSVEMERQYLRSTIELLIELILRSSWQIQLVVIQSINQLLSKSSSITSSDVLPLLEPIINLGPRSKSSNLKREVLIFLKLLLEQRRYAIGFEENESARNLLQFNIEEMIHDTRSTEISEQAKELRKQHEHLFLKTRKQPETTPVDPNEQNLF